MRREAVCVCSVSPLGYRMITCARQAPTDGHAAESAAPPPYAFTPLRVHPAPPSAQPVPRSGDVVAGRPWSGEDAPRLFRVTPEDLIERYPVLYHMAEDGTWPSVRRHGLLSAVALLDLFEASAPLRTQVLGEVRRDKTLLRHPTHGTAVIRDQRPLKFLRDVLTPGTTEQEYLDLLNGRVYLWASLVRLAKLLGARAYRDDYQTVLHVDTARLMAAHPEIELAPYNTGSMHVPNAPSAARTSFCRLPTIRTSNGPGSGVAQAMLWWRSPFPTASPTSLGTPSAWNGGTVAPSRR
jgi:hypothetical protein